MSISWTDRLRQAIEEDGRSKRRLSLDAGLGPNYIEQTFSRGSSPVQDKLAAILDELGQEAALFVYTGVRADAQTIQMLNHLAAAPEDLRRSALDLLKNLAAKQPGQTPDDR
jgi:transcriptional regulator with XRE-family HTH domain